jgi:hypothetical protein
MVGDMAQVVGCLPCKYKAQYRQKKRGLFCTLAHGLGPRATSDDGLLVRTNSLKLVWGIT